MKIFFKACIVLLLLFSITACDTTPAPTPKFETLSKGQTIELFIKSGLFPYVIDAAIAETPGQLIIVIMVTSNVSGKQAQEALNGLMRAVIGFSDDAGKPPVDKPSIEIGKTTYNYVLSAYTMNKEQVAVGAKTSGASKIYWGNPI